MPLITAFNLRKEDRLSDIENALRRALVSTPELKINDDEIDFVPILTPDGFHGRVTRINVDLWEGSHRTKEALQELAARAATAFQRVTGSDRKVKVVIRPYDVEGSGWVSVSLKLDQSASPDWPQANPDSRNPDFRERVIAPVDYLIQAEESRPAIERRFGFVIFDRSASLKE